VSVAANTFDDTVDLRVIAVRLWSRRVWLAASTVAFTAAFAAAAFLMTPVYRTAIVAVPVSTSRGGIGNLLGGALGSLGDLASLAGVNVSSPGGDTEVALAVLRSRQFTEAFIGSRHLMPELFQKKWDNSRQAWKTDVEPPTPAQAYKLFDKDIRTVIEDKKTGLVTLQIDWRDRSEAAEWANELLSRLNAEMRARAIERADASIKYLEKELAATTVVGTRDAISRLMEAQIKQRMLANVTEEYAFRVVDRAMPPDKIDVFKPKKAIMIIAGLVLGALFGAVGVLFADWLPRKRIS
jgi:uncharacterized protein involved in exopolysaccharide biosynthesis